MSEKTRPALLDQVEAQRFTYERMVELAQGQGGDTDDREWLAEQTGQDVDDIDETSETAREFIDSDMLEIVKWYKVTNAMDLPTQADYSHCEVVVCTGGPHVELNTGTRTWDGFWSGETVKLGASQDVCVYFDEMAS